MPKCNLTTSLARLASACVEKQGGRKEEEEEVKNNFPNFFREIKETIKFINLSDRRGEMRLLAKYTAVPWKIIFLSSTPPTCILMPSSQCCPPPSTSCTEHNTAIQLSGPSSGGQGRAGGGWGLRWTEVVFCRYVRLGDRKIVRKIVRLLEFKIWRL